MKPVQIIIYGATEMGLMVASRLYSVHDIILIDEQETLPERFNGLDLSYISGSGSDIELLENLELTRRDSLFISCSTTDETNIVSCWTIKKLAEVTTVCFVSRPEIYANLISSTQHRYQTKFDIDTVIWPERLLTQDIFRTIMVPQAIDVEYFLKGKVKLLEYRIKEDSPLADRRIIDYSFPKNVLIVGLTRNDKLFIPRGNTLIETGDKVMFMGHGLDLDLLTAKLFEKRRKIRSAVIIGGGSVGYYLSRQLERIKVKLKIIESDEQRCLFLAGKLSTSLVLNGDGTDIELLAEELVGEADIVICVTNNDEKNLLCSLLVKQLGGSRIVTRVNNPPNIALFEKVGIDVVVSAKESAMKELSNVLKSTDIDILATVGGGQGKVLRITVPRSFRERRVMDLKLPENVLIAVIRRGKGILIPDGATIIRPGDRLKLFSTLEKTEGIQAVFNK